MHKMKITKKMEKLKKYTLLDYLSPCTESLILKKVKLENLK